MLFPREGEVDIYVSTVGLDLRRLAEKKQPGGVKESKIEGHSAGVQIQKVFKLIYTYSNGRYAASVWSMLFLSRTQCAESASSQQEACFAL